MPLRNKALSWEKTIKFERRLSENISSPSSEAKTYWPTAIRDNVPFLKSLESIALDTPAASADLVRISPLFWCETVLSIFNISEEFIAIIVLIIYFYNDIVFYIVLFINSLFDFQHDMIAGFVLYVNIKGPFLQRFFIRQYPKPF